MKLGVYYYPAKNQSIQISRADNAEMLNRRRKSLTVGEVYC